MEGKRDSFFMSGKKQKTNHKQNNFIKKTNESQSNNKRQDNFDKNRKGLIDADEADADQVKKPFDKKTYRLKKYSKKYKLDQWEEQRKKKLLRNYYKEFQDESPTGIYSSKTFDQDSTDSQAVGRFVKHPDLIETLKTNDNSNLENFEKPAKKDPYQRAKEKFIKIKQEKLDKKIEMEKSKEEKRQKMQEYKKKKQDRFKKLSKKTKKGQPVMTGRLELLLDKIQKSK